MPNTVPAADPVLPDKETFNACIVDSHRKIGNLIEDVRRATKLLTLALRNTEDEGFSYPSAAIKSDRVDKNKESYVFGVSLDDQAALNYAVYQVSDLIEELFKSYHDDWDKCRKIAVEAAAAQAMKASREEGRVS